MPADLTNRTRSLWLAYVAIAVVSLVAALPGIAGSWVGDDFHMLTSRYYGDWGEVWGVFARHAGHYLAEEVAPGGTWPYRPVTMLTLLASHALAPQPWLHHLVSFLLHIGTGALLFAALLAQEAPRERPSAGPVLLVLTALFVLHPVGVETYVWINGRSDLLGGFFLAALVLVLCRTTFASRPGMVLVAALAFLGAGSKLPFVFAAVSAWMGLTLRLPDRGLRWRAGVPLFMGLGAYALLRGIYTPLSGRIGAAEGPLTDPSAWAAIPHLLAKSAGSLLSFRAEAMQSLAWELYQPLSITEWLGGVALLAGCVALAWRRDFGGLAFLGGAVLTLAPSVVVSRSIWLGFDRYLYMPSILLLLAGAPYAVAAVDAWAHRRWLWRAAAAALLFVAALGTRAASTAYASQNAYERALIAEHPDDPTTVFYLARMAAETGNRGLARRTLSQMPEPPWPRALIMPALALAHELSDARTRDLAIGYGLRAHPEDPLIRAHGMRWEYGRGEIADALALARSFDATDPLCPEVRRQLRLWSQNADSERKQMLREAAQEMRCTIRAR